MEIKQIVLNPTTQVQVYFSDQFSFRYNLLPAGFNTDRLKLEFSKDNIYREVIMVGSNAIIKAKKTEWVYDFDCQFYLIFS